jgi:hypothetical protein
MKNQRFRALMNPFALICALLAALLLAGPVRADDEVPPADPPSAETSSSGEESSSPADEAGTVSSEEAQPADGGEDETTEPAEETDDAEPAGEEVQPAGGVEVESAAPVEETEEAAPVVEAPALETTELPEEEQAVSAEGDETTSTADPYFYDKNGTRYDYLTIQDAIDNFETLKGVATIYVEYSATSYAGFVVDNVANLQSIVFEDYATGEDFDFTDSSTWPTIEGTVSISNQSLFFLGGFNITANTAGSVVTYSSVDHGELVFVNIENTGSGAGISVSDDSGKVFMSMVNVNGGDAGGAVFGENGDPIAGDVYLDDCSFSGSGGTGLSVVASGLITLEGVSVFENGGSGALLEGKGALVANSTFFNNGGGDTASSALRFESSAPGNLTISEVQVHTNSGYGIYASVQGSVAISRTVVTNSGNTGIYLDTCQEDGGACTNPSTGVVTLTDVGSYYSAYDVQGYGLQIENAKGAITLIRTYVNYNGDDDTASGGAFLRNSIGPAVYAVNLDYSGARDNSSNGLIIFTRGAVTLKDAGAVRNKGEYGAYIDNTGGTAAVTITSTPDIGSGFGYNYSSVAGLWVQSNGVIKLSDIYVSGNSGAGIHLDNTGSSASASVTVTGGSYSNNSGGDGLNITSKGTITVTLTNKNVNNNGGNGINLDNSSATSAKAVTVDGGYYQENQLNGIFIVSKGLVTIKNIQVNNNQGGDGININNSFASTALGVPITTTRSGWYTNINNNAGSGIVILTKGQITLMKTGANDNGAGGAVLDNQSTGGTGGIILTNCSFYRNYQSVSGTAGLEIDTNGEVKLTNVYANENGNDTYSSGGANIQNLPASGAGKNVTITNSDFNENHGDGLVVQSQGIITLKDFDATRNNGSGASLENHTAPDKTPKAVTITNGEFNENSSGFGLRVESKGAITLTNINARNNGLYGAQLNNAYANMKGGVTLVGKDDSDQFNDNGTFGLSIFTNGKIAVTHIQVNGNQQHGAVLDNDSGTSQTVTIKDAEFNDNMDEDDVTYDYGLYVISKGVITLSSVRADRNGSDSPSVPVINGVLLDNSAQNGVGVTIIDLSTQNNEGGGLFVNTTGAITVKNVFINQNSGKGAYLRNDASGSSAAVNITNTTSTPNCFDDNGDTGLEVKSNGIITLTSFEAYYNGGDGVILDNRSAATPKAVNVKTGDVIANYDGGSGLFILSDGAVTVTSINAQGNSADGVFINVDGNVTLNQVNAQGNSDDGIEVISHGNVVLKSITGGNNTNNGLTVNNTGGTGTVTMDKAKLENSFYGNGGNGVEIQSKGKVSLRYVSATNNQEAGIWIDTYQFGVGTGTVTVKDASIHSNQMQGIYVTSASTITFNKVYGFNNGAAGDYDGAELYSHDSPALLSYCGFHGNTGNGLQVDSDGYNFKNVYWYGNDTNSNGDLNLNIL